MKITGIAVDRPIATAMVFLIIIVIGVMGFHFLPVDLLPPIEWPQLTVRTNYPNVGPEEIERIVTDRVENALAGVPNVEKITSRSEEGSSRVTLEFAQGTNIDEAANDVRAALDSLDLACRGAAIPRDTPPSVLGSCARPARGARGQRQWESHPGPAATDSTPSSHRLRAQTPRGNWR